MRRLRPRQVTFAPMSNPKKYVCIHGHFYQPPRENAWLETIEVQDSAAPYHDWNERINEECYAPNATARVLNEQDHIKAITNNYERISWNMGPTLLSWLEAHDPATYARLQAADRASRNRFGGHGNALAQSYNHIIMPLANDRDRQTQVRWGIADFYARFERMPEGMWLAETACDTATLEALVDNGIRFTVLAPRQCKAVRHQDAEHFTDVHGGVDTRRAYRCPLPSGRSIDLFFYDGNVSKAVAFEGLLNDGRRLADRIRNTLDDRPGDPQLAHIATDGESYGHHHKKGEMALAYCLDQLDHDEHHALTNYGHFLELHPPTWEAQIHENSSWSCVHGVERWRSDCGCHTGGEAGWNQRWRQPLRQALDDVRDRLEPIFTREAGRFFADPWRTRDAYIQVILDRSPEHVAAFLREHARRALGPGETIRALRLLEMQRHCMLMYTSCAWFFNEVTGIETLQVLQYANRALHLCAVLTGEDYHDDFLRALEHVPSNTEANAAVAYRKAVMPARVGLRRVAMHFAAASLFEDNMAELELFNYRSDIHELRPLRAGGYRLALGRMTIVSNITASNQAFSYCVLYLGQQTMIGALHDDTDADRFGEIADELQREFRAGHVGEVIGLINTHFGAETFSVWHLFRDEKRKILLQMTERSLALATKNFNDVYYENYQLMSTMRANGMPLPDAYQAAIDYTLHRRTLEALTDEDELDAARLDRIAADFTHWRHQWTNDSDLRLAAAARLNHLLTAAASEPSGWADAHTLLDFVARLDLQPNYYRAQNAFTRIWKPDYAAGLRPDHLRAGLAVARALNFELGYTHATATA